MTSSPSTAAPASWRARFGGGGAVRLESLIVLAVLCAAMAFLSSAFLSVSNILNILPRRSVKDLCAGDRGYGEEARALLISLLLAAHSDLRSARRLPFGPCLGARSMLSSSTSRDALPRCLGGRVGDPGRTGCWITGALPPFICARHAPGCRRGHCAFAFLDPAKFDQTVVRPPARPDIAPGQWRGRHGHRELEWCHSTDGACRVHHDGRATQQAAICEGPLRRAWC